MNLISLQMFKLIQQKKQFLFYMSDLLLDAQLKQIFTEGISHIIRFHNISNFTTTNTVRKHQTLKKKIN